MMKIKFFKRNISYKIWYKKYTKIIHRENGPAITHINGDKYWYVNGQLHRTDGPAIEFADKSKLWYYHGKRIDCKSQQEFDKLIKLKAFW